MAESVELFRDEFSTYFRDDQRKFVELRWTASRGRLSPHDSNLICIPPYESRWQAECQLFALSPLRIGRDLPRMRNESRPAKLVMVVTDF